MLTSVALLGCIGEQPLDTEDVGSTDDAITGGVIDHDYIAVGEVRTIQGNCSGTLIGSRTVLTAAHCVHTLSANQVFFVTFTHSDSQGVYWAAESVNVIDNWQIFHRDLAIITLAVTPWITGEPLKVGPWPLITPMPVSFDAPQQNDGITLVGFGRTDDMAMDDGTRRSATNQISWLWPNLFVYFGWGNVCNGDSGGPAFIDDAVAGVTSAGIGACGSLAVSTRTDAHAGWIVSVGRTDVHTIGWQNPNNALDVNADGVVTPIDAMQVINVLNGEYGDSKLPAVRPGGSYIDTNGDGHITALDALLVSNWLNDNS